MIYVILLNVHTCFKYLGSWVSMYLVNKYWVDVLDPLNLVYTMYTWTFCIMIDWLKLWIMINWLIARIICDNFNLWLLDKLLTITFFFAWNIVCREPLINCCPVCGEILQISDRLNSMIHLTLCFDEGTGNQVMTGGFLTDKQASNGWGLVNLYFLSLLAKVFIYICQSYNIKNKC